MRQVIQRGHFRQFTAVLMANHEAHTAYPKALSLIPCQRWRLEIARQMP